MNDFEEFYKVYKNEHRNKANILFHYIGTTIGIIIFLVGIVNLNFYLIIISLIIGYTFAWTGHFFFEKNRPTAFKSPLLSLKADLISWKKYNKKLISKILS